MIDSILAILGGAFKGIGSWMESYTSKANTQARVKNDQTEKKDEFHNAIKNNDIEEERKRLS